jgi:transposase
LTVPEVRRLLLALDGPPGRFGFRLLWSTWRRHHQAVAQRCHIARRARWHPLAAGDAPDPVMLTTSPELTDDQWSRISALLPPQRPPIGRPPEDHRTILAGMLWIVRTGSAWRELPSTFGPWPTVYSRFRRWRQAGLWQRILDTLDSTPRSASSEVSL